MNFYNNLEVVLIFLIILLDLGVSNIEAMLILIFFHFFPYIGRMVESEWSDDPYVTQKSHHSQCTHPRNPWWATHVESFDQKCPTGGWRMLHVPNQHGRHEKRIRMHFCPRFKTCLLAPSYIFLLLLLIAVPHFT